ncbi:hypothetical protein [Streptomyces sp. HD]|uniref:hypothetical protein n=1 Tax=Streptomyces sp. HD TaxID=3020892 RepID=UPI00232D6131|nr:hypothetical protein [Streptomyces sp. HD]MDC0768564.1 hypothetical protein [Streptomyces sp. HD]
MSRVFAGDTAAVASWFQDHRATNMRLFTWPSGEPGNHPYPTHPCDTHTCDTHT